MNLVIPKTKQLLLLLLAQTGLRFWAYFLYPSLSKPSRLSMAWVPLLALRLNSHDWQVDKLFPHQVSFADWIAPVQQLRKSYQSQQRKGAKWRLWPSSWQTSYSPQQLSPWLHMIGTCQGPSCPWSTWWGPASERLKCPWSWKPHLLGFWLCLSPELPCGLHQQDQKEALTSQCVIKQLATKELASKDWPLPIVPVDIGPCCFHGNNV